MLCWGQGFFGELGNGSQTDTPMPIPVGVVGLPSGILAVAAGGQHTCALTAERIVLCWGKNGFGELGNGTTVDSLAPVAVLGLSPGVLALSAGASNTCAIMASGALRCWGLNYAGVIGNDANSKSAVAVDSTGLSSGIIEVSVGTCSQPLTSMRAISSRCRDGRTCRLQPFLGRMGPMRPGTRLS